MKLPAAHAAQAPGLRELQGILAKAKKMYTLNIHAPKNQQLYIHNILSNYNKVLYLCNSRKILSDPF